MADLNITLFGYPTVELDQTPVALDERKAMALLAYLAISGGPQSRAALGALLWPEHARAQSYASLRHALWSLKQAGLAAWLETGHDTIALRDGYRLDVAAFRQALQAGQLDQAVARYQADFLAGFALRDAPAFDEWQFFQTEHLRQALAVALQQLVTTDCARGDYQPAIVHARRWLALDPLHEPAHRQLMQLYTWAGQPTAALRQYQECARRFRDELASVPDAETTALFETIRARKLVPPALPPEHSATPTSLGNLPGQLTSFIGRAQEIAAVTRSLATSTARLVTLTGSGGCGKTRLALQVGRALPKAYPQGVWFVDLAALSDPALVPQAVAASLDLREEAGRPILATLTDYLRPRAILLILDNCEHLTEASAQLAIALLHACTNLHILATSRELLGIAGETIFRVPSLRLPTPDQSPATDALRQYEAVQLFAERAATAMPGFSVTADNAAALARICRRLDGIPLAIELAAARVTTLRVEQIDARLVETFDLLTSSSRTALPRQQTLRATMEWSYSLLSEAERVLLRHLAIFAGGWTLETAEAVCADFGFVEIGSAKPKTQGQPILDGLTELVHKSLVVLEREQGDEARYRLLETIRQYAHEQVREAGEEAAIRDRHLICFVEQAEQAEPELTGPHYVVWLQRLDDDLENIRVALEWACAPRSAANSTTAQAGLRLAGALRRYWEVRAPLSQGRDWLARLLEQPGAVARTAARAKALATLVYLNIVQAQVSAELQLLTEESLAIYHELGNQQGIAFALLLLGIMLRERDDDAAWQLRLSDTCAHYPHLAESLARYRRIGDTFGSAEVLGWLGFFAMNNDYAQAHAYLVESLALFRTLGHAHKISTQLVQLGVLALRYGHTATARDWLSQSLVIERDLGLPSVVDRIGTLGELALQQGDYAQARAYLAESLALSRATGHTRHSLWSLVNLGYVALRQGDTVSARALFVECQQRFNAAGSRIGVVYALEGLASLAAGQSQPERAARLFAWADAVREALADPRPPVEQADVERDLARIRTQLDQAAIAAACAAGRAMTTEQTIAYALEERGSDASASAGTTPSAK